jgi:hypothetical protein
MHTDTEQAYINHYSKHSPNYHLDNDLGATDDRYIQPAGFNLYAADLRAEERDANRRKHLLQRIPNI